MMSKQAPKIIILGGLALLMLAAGCNGSSSGSGGTPISRVSISPSVEEVASGVTFSRTVEVQDIGDSFYIAFDLTFDPNVIQFVNASEGPFFTGNAADPTSVQAALQDGVQGRLTIGLTRLGLIGNVSGTGTLMTLVFQAVGQGTSQLVFEQPRGLRNDARQDVAVGAWEDGTVTVQ